MWGLGRFEFKHNPKYNLSKSNQCPPKCLQVLQCRRKQKTFAVNLLFYSNGPNARWKTVIFLCVLGAFAAIHHWQGHYILTHAFQVASYCVIHLLRFKWLCLHNCAGFAVSSGHVYCNNWKCTSGWSGVFKSFRNSQPLSTIPWASWDTSNAFLVSSTIKMEQKIRIMDTLLTVWCKSGISQRLIIFSCIGWC